MSEPMKAHIIHADWASIAVLIMASVLALVFGVLFFL